MCCGRWVRRSLLFLWAELSWHCAAAVRANAAREAAMQAFAASLQRLPDGTYFNPDEIEDEGFFEPLESRNSGRPA